jgi:hypothetical protein
MHFCDQYTKEWWDLRLGIPTASQFHRIITPTGKKSGAQQDYLCWLVAERLLGPLGEDKYKNHPNIMWGVENEPKAIEAFKKKKKLTLQKVGFITLNDEAPYGAGCSPDCIVQGSVECAEIKCPVNPAIHVEYLLYGLGDNYKPQVQGQLLIGGFTGAHFYAWHPNMPAYYQYTDRNSKFLALMIEMLSEFMQLVDKETERAKDMGEFKWLEQKVTDLPGQFPWKTQD